MRIATLSSFFNHGSYITYIQVLEERWLPPLASIDALVSPFLLTAS